MRVSSYQVLGYDERRKRWRRRYAIEARVARVRYRVDSDDGLGSYLDAIARQTNMRLQLVAIVHVAVPLPCLRVQRTPVRNEGEWTLDTDLTLGILAARRRAGISREWFSPEQWLDAATARRTAHLYRVAID